MASLTPLSKGLIGLAVIGGMASAVWHLALKERFSAPVQATAPTTSSTPEPVNPPVNAPEPQPAAAQAPLPVSPAPVATGNPAASQMSAADNAEQGRKLLARGEFAQARVHLEQAAKDGDGSAACHLGDMTLKGQGGITANQDQAAKWFQLAQSRNVICFAPGQ